VPTGTGAVVADVIRRHGKIRPVSEIVRIVEEETRP
jgi:hypothetical protein